MMRRLPPGSTAATTLLLILTAAGMCPAAGEAADSAGASRPNVILVMTDDQGFGDLGLNGNPVIRTPVMDRIGREAVRLESFYVCPVCAPTRACLMTGRYNYRTGVLDTWLGRAMMYPDEVTLAEMLSQAGYRTGVFGKWHLGDNYPMRPGDQGFQESLIHRGGGIGQPADHPDGTSYFDPVLFHNGDAVKKSGYCSDIYTDAAIDFIEESRKHSFFVYLPYNCPHTPLEVPESYHAMYRDRDLSRGRFPPAGHPLPEASPKARDGTARIYGMVTNIDDNLGRLLRKLDTWSLTKKTLVVFLTDNGPQQPRYNAGMRQRKGSVYDGGIRVPCYWRWPGTLEANRTVDRIAAHIDVVPTILEICGVHPPEDVRMDGKSLWPLLSGRDAEWPDRHLVFQWHRGDTVEPYRACAIRNQRYKLVQAAGAHGGSPGELPPFQLFDMQKDPFEEHDIAAREPEIVQRMKERYDRWYRDVTEERGFEPPRIVIDGVHEDPCTLTRQDWRGPKAGWAPRSLGFWEVRVTGDETRYDIVLRFAPTASASRVRLRIGDIDLTREVEKGASGCRLSDISLPRGPGRFQSWVEDSKGEFGVHQVDICKRH